MEKKDNTGTVVLIIIVAIAVFFAAYGLFNLKEKTSDNEETIKNERNEKDLYQFVKNGAKKAPWQNKSFKKYFAELYITGIIQDANENYNQGWLLDTIDELENDKNNQGILLVIDSPGGTVYESDEVFLALMEYKANTGRPVVAYLKSIAASGGYYIACAADKIIANRNTLTGSIGVICGQAVDVTKLLDEFGIVIKTFTAGRNKNMLNFNEPLTDEQENIMLTLAEEAYEQFTGIVSESRNIPIEDIQDLADGRIYSGAQAKTLGLIDEIKGFEDAKDSIRNESENSDWNFRVFDYHYEPNFFDMLKTGTISAQKALSTKDSNNSNLIASEALKMNMPNIKYPAYLYNQN